MNGFIVKFAFICASLSLSSGDNNESRSDYYRNYGQEKQEQPAQQGQCCCQLPPDQQEFMEKLGPLHAAIYRKAFNPDLRQETLALYMMSAPKLTPNQAVERVIEAYRDESNNRTQAMPQRKSRRRQHNY